MDRFWQILRMRLRSLFRRDSLENELEEELAYHVDRRIETYVSSGLTAEAARTAALRDMDGLERRKDECRDLRHVSFVDDLRHDVRYTLRTLAKSPTFTLVAIGTLALGIAATVGIFTVVETVLLRPLPLADPQRLVVIGAEDVKSHGRVGASWTKFELLRAGNTSFSGTAASVGREFTVTVKNDPMQVTGARVTYEFFDVLGVAPEFGRLFRRDEDVEGAAPVAIITDAFWRNRLSADPAVVGTAIRIDGRPATIVGVLPAFFRFTFADREPQIFMTAVFTPAIMTPAQIQNGAGFLEYIFRLKPGVTIDQARAELASFDERYRREFGGRTDANKYRLSLTPFVDSLVGNVRPALLVLMGAVLLVLLIACANVAHLLLARAATRQRELALRLAIGASRGRLIRQLLTESVTLATGGCLVGVLAARIAIAVLIARGPANIPRLQDASPDAWVIAFAVLLAGVSALVFGIWPALRATDVSAGEVLRDGRAGGTTSRASARLQRWLATSETALTVALLIAAGLLFESLMRLEAVNPGFTAEHVYTAHVTLPRGKYADPAQREQFFTELLRNVEALPGVSSAGAISYLPMGNDNYGFFFYVEGQEHLGPGRDHVIAVRHVSADYFKTMRIPVRSGRTFTEQDTAGAEPVTIINESAANKFFPGVNPIGRHVANSGDRIMRRVVGVVGDVHYDGPTRSGQEELYLPYRQVPWPSMSIVVASDQSSDAVARALRTEVSRLDRDQAMTEIRTMASVVAATTTQQQFTTSLLGTFAILATALAAIGLYGVVALFVSQRRHEFGVRMALGASRLDVLRLAMREGVNVIGVGTIAGLTGAALGSRALSGLLFGVTATSPSVYAGAIAILVVIGLVASYVPARRATSVDPARALRAE